MRVDTGKYPEGVDPVRVKRLKLLSKVALNFQVKCNDDNEFLIVV